MKKTLWILVVALVGVTGWSYGYDRAGVFGLSYTVGPSFIAGGSNASDAGTVEPGVGTALQLGLSRNLDAVFSYDYVDADLRTQALIFGADWRFTPEAAYCPFFGAGMGFGKPFSGQSWGHFALKFMGGIEHPITSNLSLAGTLSYNYVNGPDPFGSVHAIEPGARLIFYFGNLRR